MKNQMHLAHIVFFKLKDGSPALVQELLDGCQEFLTGHPGTVYYSAGTLNPELKRPVNDHDYHVALHVVFDSRDSHDLYQIAARHLKFIEKFKPNWETIRVFDSDIPLAG